MCLLLSIALVITVANLGIAAESPLEKILKRSTSIIRVKFSVEIEGESKPKNGDFELKGSFPYVFLNNQCQILLKPKILLRGAAVPEESLKTAIIRSGRTESIMFNGTESILNEVGIWIFKFTLPSRAVHIKQNVDFTVGTFLLYLRETKLRPGDQVYVVATHDGAEFGNRGNVVELDKKDRVIVALPVPRNSTFVIKDIKTKIILQTITEKHDIGGPFLALPILTE